MFGSSIASSVFRQRDLPVLGLILAVCGCLDSQHKSLQTDSDRNRAAEEGRDTVAAPPDSIPPGILEQRRFLEAPLLAEQVKSGQLPPVHLRLPEVPLVIRPIAEIGQYGGTLRRALTADIIEEDGIYKTLNDSLMTFARPLPKSIELNLAEEYRFYDDGRTMIMKIRKGTRWSDGEPFNVDDILFWYYDMTFDDNARSLALFPSEWMVDEEPIKLEKIDRYTLRFSSPKPLGRILHALCRDPVAYPKHVLAEFHPRYNPEATYEKFRSRTSEARLILEPGIPRLSAWVPVEWVHGQRVVYERNPYYWKIDTAGNQLPYADRLVFEIIPDRRVIYLKFTNGEIDLVGRYGGNEMLPALRKAEKKGIIKLRVTGPERGSALYLNWDAPDPALRTAFRDRRVRIALSLAIDREEISALEGRGLMSPGGYSFAPGSRYYSEEAYRRFSVYEPDRARKLLDEAGYSDRDGDGWREFKDGSRFELTLDLVISPGAIPTTYELISDYWRAIGVKTHLFAALEDIIYPRRLNGGFDVLSWGLEAPQDPLGRPNAWGIMTAQTPFWHRNASVEGPAWLQEATDHLKKAMTSIDPEEVKRHMIRVRDLHTDNISVIGIGSNYHVWGAHTRLGNVPYENTKAHVFRGWGGSVFHEQIFIRRSR